MGLLYYLADVTARSLGLAAAVLLGVWVFRVKTAAGRHAALTVAAGGMLLLAGLAGALPAIPLRVLPAERAAAVVAVREVWVDAEVPTVAPAVPPAASKPQRREWLAELRWPVVASAVYLGVMFVLLLRLAYGYLFTRRLVRASRREGEVYGSTWISVPMTVGWARPKILLPVGWKEWDASKLAAVLAHERMHIARADWAIAALAAVNRCVFWFHPLAWWLERKLAFLAEQACDDAALLQTGARESYAEALLDMAAAVKTGRGRMVWEAMAMARTAEVRKRIERILDESREIPRGLTRGRWAALVGCSLPLMVVMAAARLAPAAAALETPVEMAEAQVGIEQALPPAAAPQATGGRGGGIAATPRPAEAQYQAKRLFVLYFDLQGMSPNDRVLAQADAQRFLGEQLTSDDLVAVMSYAGQLKVLQDFTRDRDPLLQAVRSLPSGVEPVSGGSGDTEASIFLSDRQLSALQSAVKMLSTLPEKKAMVYFGKGMPRVGINNDVQLRATISAALQANVAFYPVDAQGNVATPAGAPGVRAQFQTEIGEHVVRASREAPYPYRLMVAVEPVHKVDPAYPPEVLTGVVGNVRFQVLIGTDGHVKNAELLENCPGRNCPPRELVAPAREAVSQYVYAPPKASNGEPAEIETMVSVPFGQTLDTLAEIRVLTQNYQALYDRNVADPGADHAAQVLSKVEPEYPYAQRALGHQGTVTVEVTVGVDGAPKDIRVTQSDPAFDAAVIAAMRQWRFTPARQNGQPVESTVTLPVSFRLE